MLRNDIDFVFFLPYSELNMTFFFFTSRFCTNQILIGHFRSERKNPSFFSTEKINGQVFFWFMWSKREAIRLVPAFMNPKIMNRNPNSKMTESIHFAFFSFFFRFSVLLTIEDKTSIFLSFYLLGYASFRHWMVYIYRSSVSHLFLFWYPFDRTVLLMPFIFGSG